MKVFINKLFIFAIPIILFVLLIIISDPYNYFNVLKLISDNTKKESIGRSPETMVLGSVLIKTHEYKKSPSPYLILGDSRAYNLNTSHINEISGVKYFNMGIPGGNYRTLINLFWFANSKIKLKKVYIFISFHNYIKSWGSDLFSEAVSVDKTITPYFTRPLLVNQAFYNYTLFIKEIISHKRFNPYKISKNKPQKKVPFVRKENKQLWDKRINEQKDHFVHWYKRADDYHDSIIKISDYCKKNNIEVCFIIAPNHSDFHKLIKEVNLESEMLKFKRDFCQLAEVFDYDYDNVYTLNRSLFSDIFHANDSVYSIVCKEVWGKNQSIKFAIHSFPDSLKIK